MIRRNETECGLFCPLFGDSLTSKYFIYAAYLFVPVFSNDLRMRNFSIFSICSHFFKKSSIILLEYNAF